MAGTPFQWRPGQDQTYTLDNGSQTLGNGPFDKDCATTFRMQASGQILILYDPSGPQSTWGGQCPGLPTTMMLQDGTLQYGDPDRMVQGGLFVYSTDVILQNAAAFQVYTPVYRGGDQSTVNRVNLSGASSVEITCGIEFNTSDRYQINDTAHMKVTSATIFLDGCALTVLSELPMDRLSLELQVPAARPDETRFFQVSKSTLLCGGSSKSVLRVPQGGTLSFNDASVVAIGNSRLEIYADDIQFSKRDSTVFQMQDSCAVVFNGATATSAPFDFLNKTYPMGLFSFQSPMAGTSASTCLIRNCGSAYSFNAMLQQELIYINGHPVKDDKAISHQYVNGDLVLKPT